MKYNVEKNQIVVYDMQDFNVKQTLDCGQIFRYQIEGNKATVFSKDKKAVIETLNDKIIIITEDTKYFEHFFDLKTDYATIKSQLKKDNLLTDAVEYGYGIRILNNDTYEMIVSFIISANNNIKRIKKSIEWLCERFGANKGTYYAFPTLGQLKSATVDDYKRAGLGYRAEYLKEFANNWEYISDKVKFDYKSDFELFKSCKGIGDKVSNCICLYGYNEFDAFPIDVWMKKIIKEEYTDKGRELKIPDKYAGILQQFMFYTKRLESGK